MNYGDILMYVTATLLVLLLLAIVVGVIVIVFSWVRQEVFNCASARDRIEPLEQRISDLERKVGE